MTGGKGDPDGVGPGGDPDPTEDCKLSYPGARLVAPKNLSKIQKGELLKLEVRKVNGSPVLFAFTRLGVDIGAVTVRSQGQIIRCIERGYQYGAEVITLDGGDCTLTINRTGSP
jgi:hypothetical protein